MATHGPQNWTGSLFLNLGFLGLAGGLGTLAYQGSFWWFDGDWITLQVGSVVSGLGEQIPLLNWPGAQVALYWLSNQPLSATLLASGIGCYMLGRGLGG